MVELPNLPEELAPYSSLLTGLARPCLSFAQHRDESALPPGASKVGGHPDLPDGTAWPVNEAGVPVPFAFQVNLADLGERYPGLLPLPERAGLLQFFTTFVAEETWSDGNQWRDDWFEAGHGDNRILVHPDLDRLRPATAGPPPFQEEWRLDPEPAVSLPGYLELHDRFPDLLAVLREDKRLGDAYRDWLSYELGFGHGIGGYPRWLQDPGYSEAAARDRGLRFADVHPSERTAESRALLARLVEEGASWHLVLQLDSILGDDGRMYLLAPPDPQGRYDLARLQFVYQCT